MNIIGVSGYARSGKNLFADLTIKFLKEKYNKSATSVALATYLKQDLKDFIYEKTKLNSFTEIDNEKLLIRPMLVAYGNLMRDITNGTYWTQKLEDHINENLKEYDYIFVTDVRYDEYPKDEVYWIKKKMNGILVHLSKYSYQTVISKRHVHTSKPLKIYDSPANDYERFNDPKLIKQSDVDIEWESLQKNQNAEELFEDIIESFIKNDLKL